MVIREQQDSLRGTPRPGQTSGEKMVLGPPSFCDWQALTHFSLSSCSDVPTSREGSTEPYGQSNCYRPFSRPISLCRTANALYHLAVYLNREGTRSLVKGKSGFPKTSQGRRNFMISSLQSSRHPFVGSVFSTLCIFHKTKRCPFQADSPNDLYAVYCLWPN